MKWYDKTLLWAVVIAVAFVVLVMILYASKVIQSNQIPPLKTTWVPVDWRSSAPYSTSTPNYKVVEIGKSDKACYQFADKKLICE